MLENNNALNASSDVQPDLLENSSYGVFEEDPGSGLSQRYNEHVRLDWAYADPIEGEEEEDEFYLDAEQEQLLMQILDAKAAVIQRAWREYRLRRSSPKPDNVT